MPKAARERPAHRLPPLTRQARTRGRAALDGPACVGYDTAMKRSMADRSRETPHEAAGRSTADARTDHAADAVRRHRRTLPSWVYKAMLVLAAAIWGLGTVAVKDTVDALPPLWLVGIRFLLSGVILCIVCLPRLKRSIDRDAVAAGAFLGLFLAASYLCNTSGLTGTTAAKSSFLTSTYCAFVPFFAWALSRIRPTRYNIAAAVLCLAGVGFVSFSEGFESFSFGAGEAITLVSAGFLGLHIAFTARLSDGRDALALTAIQFLVAGVVGCTAGFACEGALPREALTRPDMLANVAYLVVFASCIALSLQNVGVAHVPPAPAALFLATESVFGVLFSVTLLGETVTALMAVGFALIGAGIVVSEAFPLRKRRLDANAVACEERRASEQG